MLFPTYDATGKVVVMGASGIDLMLSDGQTAIDMNSGYWNVPFGHCHKGIREAMSTGFFCDVFQSVHPPALELATQLCARTGYARVLFTNSGSDAVDCAVRLAWQYAMSRHGNAKRDIAVLKRAYHGSTTISFALGGYAERERWIPMGFTKRTLGDWTTDPSLGLPDPADELVDPLNLAAFLFEPLQGSAGGRRLRPTAYKGIARICREADVLLVADEVATGMGRLGQFLATESYIPRPDLVCIGKALTNGEFPMAAVLVSDKVWDAINASADHPAARYRHGFTYGGHPTGCLAALEVLHLLDDEMLMHIDRQGLECERMLRAFPGRLPNVRAVYGTGLFWGIELQDEPMAIEVAEKLLARHRLRIGREGKRLTFVPGFTLDPEEYQLALVTIEAALQT